MSNGVNGSVRRSGVGPGDGRMTVGVEVRQDVAVGRIARAEVWAVGTAGEGALEGRENTSGPRATVWPRHHRACVLWCAVCCAASLPSERKRE